MNVSDVQRAAYKAVREAELEPQSCEICGAEPTEGHHDDYTKPLEVRWLCKSHHNKWHGRYGSANGRVGPCTWASERNNREALRLLANRLMVETGCSEPIARRWLAGGKVAVIPAYALDAAARKLKIERPKAKP